MTRYPSIFRLPATVTISGGLSCYCKSLYAALLLLVLTACGSSSPQHNANTSQLNTAGLSDYDIASAVYFDQRTPDGFYQERYDDGNFYSISHVRNTDLVPLAARNQMNAYQLSADSYAQALDWSQQAMVYQPGNRQLVDSSESFFYYQFTYVDPAAPQFIHLARVYRAQLLDRNGVNEDYLGRIVSADITAAQARQLVEYLWSFTDSNNYGNAVLGSVMTETEVAFELMLLEAKLVVSAVAGQCDSIDVYENRYLIDKSSGFIRKQTVLQRVISARRTGSMVETCQ